MIDPTITGCFKNPLKNIAHGPRGFFRLAVAASAGEEVIEVLIALLETKRVGMAWPPLQGKMRFSRDQALHTSASSP
jgi:hypothetical protein